MPYCTLCRRFARLSAAILRALRHLVFAAGLFACGAILMVFAAAFIERGDFDLVRSFAGQPQPYLKAN